jgi:hypothetical protein
VKLLFDENLSPKLAGALAQDFPGSKHVEDIRLRGSADEKIWDCARQNGFSCLERHGFSGTERPLERNRIPGNVVTCWAL